MKSINNSLKERFIYIMNNQSGMSNRFKLLAKLKEMHELGVSALFTKEIIDAKAIYKVSGKLIIASSSISEEELLQFIDNVVAKHV
ncbi:hypothetical protein GZH44_06770 [Weissella hellenica]|nr:hypothetical protein GZH44_06770 [Weissella hellenica]